MPVNRSPLKVGLIGQVGQRLSRRMLLAMGGFWTTVVLGRKYVAIAQTHPLYRNEVKIYIQGSWRYVVSNGIPNHTTGQFPNAGNPNTISPQSYTFRVPAKPQIAAQTSDTRRMLSGVALNGVAFEPGTGEFWNGDRNWRYEALSGKINLGLDRNNAHVQPSGAYHYHGLPVGLIEVLGQSENMLLLGYAADGFPIYNSWGYSDPRDLNSALKRVQPSYRLKPGERPSGPGGRYDGTFTQDYEYVAELGDLDECNGRFGVTPDFPQGIYHYYITDTFPIITRRFRGTPDPSFQHQGSPPQSRPQRPPGQVPGGMPGSSPPAGYPPPRGFPPHHPPNAPPGHRPPPPLS